MDLLGCRCRRLLTSRWTLLQVLFVILQTSTGGQSSAVGSQGRIRKTIKVATMQIEPYVKLKWSPGLIANEKYAGLFIDLLKEVAGQVGFDYQLYLVPDGKTGKLGDNGHWNGLIGELERGSADLALAPIIATPERQHVVHFLSPISPVKITSLSRDHSKTQLPYCLVLNSEALYAIKTNPDLYNAVKRHGHMYAGSIMEGLDKAREGQCHLLITDKLAEYYADQEPCDMTCEPFYDFPDLVYSLATARTDQISAAISAVLDRMTAEGATIERLEHRWLRGSCMRAGTLPTSLDTTVNTDSQPSWTKLYITSILTEPYLMRSNKRGVEFEGYIADLVQHMTRVLSLDYEWRVQRRIGKRKADGSWTGMMGELTEGTADLAAAPFITDADQEAVLSFSKPFLESTLSLVIKAPTDVATVPTVIIEDLLNQSSYDFGIVHKSRLAKQLRQSQLPLYKQLWRRLKEKDKENRIASIKEGLRRVRRGQFALVMESPEATYISSRRPCDLVSLSQYLAVTQYTFVTAKGSPLVDHLNLALQQLQEAGVLQALFHKWWNADECADWNDRPPARATPEADRRQHEQTAPPTGSSTTPSPSPAPLKPVLQFDIDRLFGLSTEVYPYVGNDTDYDAYDDEDDADVRDLERIFLTSPISAFTPRRPDDDVIGRPDVTTGGVTSGTSQANSTEATNAGGDWRQSRLDLGDNVTLAPSERDGARQMSDATDATPVTLVDATPTSTTKLAKSTRKSRRKGRTRRPRRRKGRRRSTTPLTTSTSSAITTPTNTVQRSRDRSPDFNRNIDWFFVTQLPRPDDYDDYENYNLSRADNLTSFTSDRPEVPRATTPMPSQFTVGSVAPSSDETSTAVLIVVVIHLVIFGWPPLVQDCQENCDR